MKKLILILLTFVLLLSGCSTYRTNITREEIVAAYQGAGYDVASGIYENASNGLVAYVQASGENGDYIYFSFYSTPEEAKAHKEEFYHPVMMGLFSVIYGDPMWIRWETYGCIVVSYSEPKFMEPFEKLLSS